MNLFSFDILTAEVNCFYKTYNQYYLAMDLTMHLM